jgi:hypothetical protein
MHQFNGFGDLRLNARSRASEITLWPSFTDIMTVILMVFMLTMVVVIVKNAYLAERVRLNQHMVAEKEAELAESLASLASVRAEIDDLEEQLRAKEMEIILLGDENAAMSGNLEAKLAIIDRLRNQQEELQHNIRLLRTRVREMEEEAAANEEALTAANLALSEQSDDFQRQLADLLAQLEDKDAVLLTLRGEKSDLELDLARQRREFSTLEDRYLKLVRPARSSAGRAVATVRYFRVGPEETRILLTGVGETAQRRVSLAELHRELGALKEKYGDKLYVKIVIPDDSGLSYNEAWRFTKDILQRYDYYYAEGWPNPDE